MTGALFYKFWYIITVRVSTSTLREYIVSYPSMESVGKQIILKEIPSKDWGLLKDKEMLEDEEGKEVCNYADIFSERRSTDQLRNG